MWTHQASMPDNNQNRLSGASSKLIWVSYGVETREHQGHAKLARQGSPRKRKRNEGIESPCCPDQTWLRRYPRKYQRCRTMQLIKIKRQISDAQQSHTDKKSTQSGEHHQLATLAKYRFIPGRYNPLEEVANTNKLNKLHFRNWNPL